MVQLATKADPRPVAGSEAGDRHLPRLGAGHGSGICLGSELHHRALLVPEGFLRPFLSRRAPRWFSQRAVLPSAVGGTGLTPARVRRPTRACGATAVRPRRTRTPPRGAVGPRG